MYIASKPVLTPEIIELAKATVAKMQKVRTTKEAFLADRTAGKYKNIGKITYFTRGSGICTAEFEGQASTVIIENYFNK